MQNFTPQRASQKKGSDFSFAGERWAKTRSSGFTLIELLVVFVIIVTITTVALTSQSAFNKTIILANTAYDVALSLRSAQTYGLGSRVAGMTVSAGYGLHFDRTTPNKFTLFTDTYPSPGSPGTCHPGSVPGAPDAKPGDCAYESANGERITEYTLGNQIVISDLCAYFGSWRCAVTNGSTIQTLDIVFARPNPDSPYISLNGTYTGLVTNACITLTSPYGGSRFVSIAASGAINANATSCP